MVVPLMEERVEVGTAITPAGAVRVRIDIDEGRERVTVDDVREEYQPSVRSIGLPADARRGPYLDGDEVVIPVYEERAIVERRLFLKEEIRLRRARHIVHEERDVPVRRERAVFERQQADGSWREVALSPGAPVAEHTARTRAPRRPSDHLPFHLQESSMNQTVVGVFNSHEAAERAAEALASQGFDRSQMHVKSTGADATSTTTGSTSASAEGEGTGIMASIRHFFSELFGDDEQSGHYAEAVRRGGAVLAVETDDDRIDVARDALMQAGAVDIEEQVSNWRSQGWSGHDAGAEPYSSELAASERQSAMASEQENVTQRQRQNVGTSDQEQNVLPVVQEELEVGKRQVRGGAVRVVSRVVSKPVRESVELRREEAAVERHPVDRPATEADLAAMQERTIEVTEMAERPVVNKSARVVEEVVVGKHVSSDTQVVEDTVRRSEVEVERVGGDESRGGGTGREQLGASQATPAGAMGSSGAGGAAAGSMAGLAMGGAATSSRRNFADLDDEFRQDYQTNYANSGVSYDDLQPAYRGGYESRSDSRFANGDWDSAEPQLRQRWESEHPGSAWERVKAAFRRGWDRATS